MESNELRIGNILTQGAIVSFYETGIHVGFGITCVFKHCKPIPLTEDWLLKFGFEYSLNDMKLLLQRGRIGFIYYGGLAGQLDIIQDGKQISTYTGCTSYVHQLQNLYFALTGRELSEINVQNLDTVNEQTLLGGKSICSKCGHLRGSEIHVCTKDEDLIS